MRSIRRILVAVKDPGSKSLPAVAKAAQLARSLGAELELFHGISASLYVNPYVSPAGQLDQERQVHTRFLEQLESLAAPLRRRHLKVTVSAEWDFPAYEAIVRRADEMHADLIVAERHATGHLGASLLRLTDWELLRLSPVPVLLVKTARPYRRPVVLAAVDPGHSFSKPSTLDREILQAATAVSSALRGTLHAMHAYAVPPLIAPPYGVIDADAAQVAEADAAAEAKHRLDRALRTVKIGAARRHLVRRNAVDAIAQTADELRTGIVVMGAISRSGLRRLIIGNTAERVLDFLECDVLIVKPRRFRNRVPRARRGAHLSMPITTVRPLF
jgi:universal stress protein E